MYIWTLAMGDHFFKLCDIGVQSFFHFGKKMLVCPIGLMCHFVMTKHFIMIWLIQAWVWIFVTKKSLLILGCIIFNINDFLTVMKMLVPIHIIFPMLYCIMETCHKLIVDSKVSALHQRLHAYFNSNINYGW